MTLLMSDREDHGVSAGGVIFPLAVQPV